jgi:hypothetical protein
MPLEGQPGRDGVTERTVVSLSELQSSLVEPSKGKHLVNRHFVTPPPLAHPELVSHASRAGISRNEANAAGA